jgi:hypothetical protein
MHGESGIDASRYIKHAETNYSVPYKSDLASDSFCMFDEFPFWASGTSTKTLAVPTQTRPPVFMLRGWASTDKLTG